MGHQGIGDPVTYQDAAIPRCDNQTSHHPGSLIDPEIKDELSRTELNMKRKTPTKAKAQTALTIRNGPPTQQEIDKIAKEHRAIVQAGLSIVPKAMAIGDWFIGCKKRVSHGAWDKWLKCSFPKISVRSIQLYVRLAQHRQFIEVEFCLNQIRNGAADSIREFDKFVSLREADHAVRELDKAKKKAKNGQSPAIDVEATTTVLNGSEAEALTSTPTRQPAESMFGEKGIKVPPPPEVAATITDQIEDPDDEPKEVLRQQIAAYVEHLHQADAILKSIHEWIKVADLDDKTVAWAIRSACARYPELEQYAAQNLNA